ncbi:hypothetical protein OKA04_12120 [Luteolibacter flavescens]|uniref:Uncharacterized protein n=1 Tax=Luteolibacter flavescens TaxID=1859460 RepID=A0ABT3FPH4_9BACT|nr:hypothetical protein [Luteolibacter flavescens]MCW1885476.1 hypothetical protein [Luteolibacter flavescens]
MSPASNGHLARMPKASESQRSACAALRPYPTAIPYHPISHHSAPPMHVVTIVTALGRNGWDTSSTSAVHGKTDHNTGPNHGKIPRPPKGP